MTQSLVGTRWMSNHTRNVWEIQGEEGTKIKVLRVEIGYPSGRLPQQAEPSYWWDKRILSLMTKLE